MPASDRSARDDRPIRVLIVDDHRMVAEGLALTLERQPGIEVVGTVTSGADALRTATQETPQVVLMDYHLGEGSGATAAAAIREALPDTAVIMISGDADELVMLAALEAGASGFILKTAGGDALAIQIRRAAEGEMLISPEHLQHLLRLHSHRGTVEQARTRRLEQLTDRELEILHLMGDGLDNSAIAERLSISYHTVRGHVRAILRKLEARSKLEAVARAHSEGLLP